MLKMDVIIVNKNHARVNVEIPGGKTGGSSKSPSERKFLRGEGVQTKNLPWEGYGYFLKPHIHIYMESGSLSEIKMVATIHRRRHSKMQKKTSSIFFFTFSTTTTKECSL